MYENDRQHIKGMELKEADVIVKYFRLKCINSQKDSA